MSYCNNLLDPNPVRGTTKVWRRLSLLSLLLSTTFGAQNALAKFEDYLTKRWYNIEVIVFERSNINDKNTLEALTRPLPAVDIDPSAEAIDTTELLSAPSSGSSQLKPEQEPPQEEQDAAAVTDYTEAVLQGAREPTEQRLRLETQRFEEDPTNESIRLEFLEAINAYELELQSRNLVFQADANPRLDSELQRLSRPRNHNIVWRGHWLQAVPERNDPQPLEVAANELESGELQLTGSIEVTVSRYLHLHAQLWFHDPEFGPEESPEEGSELDQTGDSAQSSQPVGLTAGDTLGTPGQQQNRPNQTLAQNSTTRFDDQALAPVVADASLIEPEVPTPYFMVLDETRRMRSGLLHYLDHPKLGLLVRIDKLTVPEALLTQYKLFEATQK